MGQLVDLQLAAILLMTSGIKQDGQDAQNIVQMRYKKESQTNYWHNFTDTQSF